MPVEAEGLDPLQEVFRNLLCLLHQAGALCTANRWMYMSVEKQTAQPILITLEPFTGSYCCPTTWSAMAFLQKYLDLLLA